MDRLYSLAPSIWGAGEEIELASVIQAPLFEEFGATKKSAFLPVLLHPNPLNGSWRVRRVGHDRTQGRVLGEVAAAHRERYPEMQRIEASLLMPTTVAEIRFDNQTGLFRAKIILPPPELTVPRNDPPEGALVLPPGDMIVVDTAKGEFSADELVALSPGIWFVALRPLAGTVAVTLNGKALGGFAAKDAKELLAYIEEAGAPLYARAVLLEGMAALNAGAPAEGLQTIPVLKVPDTTPTTPWSLVDFPDGSWAITVERPFATDPEDTVRPHYRARYVSLTGQDRPDDVVPPTQMFTKVERPEDKPEDKLPADKPEDKPVEVRERAVVKEKPEIGWQGSGGYLTEIEKVQLRRRERVAVEVGRHRK